MVPLTLKGGLYGPAAKRGYTTQPVVSPTVANPLMFNTSRYLPKTNFNQALSPAPSLAKKGTQELDSASGKESVDPASGNQLFTEERQMPNLRPVVDILNFVTANKKINQIKDEQLARKNLYLNAPSLSVRPVQDLSPEILAAQEGALSQTRSEYQGSDPVMDLLGKHIAATARGKMRNEQIAGRAGQLMQERGRFDEQSRQNQLSAAETANKNLEREQEFADYRTGVKTAALDAKEKLNASVLSQIGQNIDTAAQYNLSSEAIERANKRQTYNDMLKLAASADTPQAEATLMAKAEEYYSKEVAPYTAKPIPTYGRAQAGAISNKWINRVFGQRAKLIPR